MSGVEDSVGAGQEGTPAAPEAVELVSADEYRLAHEAALAALVALQPREDPDTYVPPRWSHPKRQVRRSSKGTWTMRH